MPRSINHCRNSPFPYVASATNGASACRGLNMFFDDDPAANLHVFANANIERAMYTTLCRRLRPHPGLSLASGMREL